MEKIIFENLPSTNTPINASNLNQLQTNVENEFNKITNYSTEEQVIGTWTDGKPIYRKPVLINETVTNAQYIKLTNFNVDTMVNLYSKAKRIDDDREFFGNFYDSNSRKFIIHYVNGEIGIWSDTTENYIATIIVEYTKTTD